MGRGLASDVAFPTRALQAPTPAPLGTLAFVTAQENLLLPDPPRCCACGHQLYRTPPGPAGTDLTETN